MTIVTELLACMEKDINTHGSKEYQLTTDRTISDLIIPKFLLFVLRDSDCPDVKDVLTNWIETGRPDKDAARAASYASSASSSYSSSALSALYAASAAWWAASAVRDAWYAADAAYCAASAASAANATNAAIDISKTYDSYGDELLRLIGETT